MSLEKQFAESERKRLSIQQKVGKIKEQQLSLSEISREVARLRDLLLKEAEARRVHRQAEKTALAKIVKYLDQYV